MLLRPAPNPPRRYACRSNTLHRIFRAFSSLFALPKPRQRPWSCAWPGRPPLRREGGQEAEAAPASRGARPPHRPGHPRASRGGRAGRGGRPGRRGRRQRGSSLPSRETPAAAPAGAPRSGAFATRRRARTAPPRTLACPGPPLPLGGLSSLPPSPRPLLPRPLPAPSRSAWSPLGNPSSSPLPAALSGPSFSPGFPTPSAASTRPKPPVPPQVSARSRLRPRAAQPPAALSFLFAPRRGSPARPAPGAGSRAGGAGKRCPPRRRGSPLGKGGARPSPAQAA